MGPEISECTGLPLSARVTSGPAVSSAEVQYAEAHRGKRGRVQPGDDFTAVVQGRLPLVRRLWASASPPQRCSA